MSETLGDRNDFCRVRSNTLLLKNTYIPVFRFGFSYVKSNKNGSLNVKMHEDEN